MREVVIAGYLRTAQSRSRPNDPARDWFHKLRADELLAKLLPEVIKRTGIRPEEIDDFIVGSAYGVSEQWSYGGRFPIFLANLPEKIPAKFVDQQCGSGMACIHFGFLEIAAGFADIVMVGGMEHMTRVPMGGTCPKREHISLNKRLFTDPAYKHWDMVTSPRIWGSPRRSFLPRADLPRKIWIAGGLAPINWPPRLIKKGFSKMKSSPSKPSRQTERFWSWIETRPFGMTRHWRG